MSQPAKRCKNALRAGFVDGQSVNRSMVFTDCAFVPGKHIPCEWDSSTAPRGCGSRSALHNRHNSTRTRVAALLACRNIYLAPRGYLCSHWGVLQVLAIDLNPRFALPPAFQTNQSLALPLGVRLIIDRARWWCNCWASEFLKPVLHSLGKGVSCSFESSCVSGCSFATG